MKAHGTNEIGGTDTTRPETSETSPQVAKSTCAKPELPTLFAMVPVHACPWWVQLGEILLISFGSNLMSSDVSGYQALPRKPATAEP